MKYGMIKKYFPFKNKAKNDVVLLVDVHEGAQHIPEVRKIIIN